MLVAAAVIPHPPLLVPELASGASAEFDELRAKCFDALAFVADAQLDRVVVVGEGATRETFPAGSRGTFSGFGVAIDVALPGLAESEVVDSATHSATLPLSLRIAAWLMAGASWPPSLTAESVPRDMQPVDAANLGRKLTGGGERVGLIAMGDGSAALQAASPGYVVPGADVWQHSVSAAIAAADVDALLALAPDDGRKFAAAGRSSWQVLAGAAAGQTWKAELLSDSAPRGVAYLVATWQPSL